MSRCGRNACRSAQRGINRRGNRVPAAGSLQELIYLGDHVRARVELAGSEAFMVKLPIDRGAPLPRDRRGGRAGFLGARTLPRVCAAKSKRRSHSPIRGGRHEKQEHVVRGSALAAAVVLALAAPPRARDLTVVSWGGAYQDAQREVYFKPFMDKTKIKMPEENWDGGVGVLRAKVQGGNNNWDVVQVESDELLLGCEEGLYEKIDWAKLGGKDKYLPDAVHDCGVGAIVYSFVLAYDGDKIKDERRRPGPISGTCRSSRASARCAKGRRRRSRSRCMADGVPPKDVYKTLGDRRRRRARVQEARPAQAAT